MNPVVAGIIVGVVLILAGLLMCRYCDSAGAGLSKVVYIGGVILLVLGLLIVFFPVLAWVYRQLIEMFGLQGGRSSQ